MVDLLEEDTPEILRYIHRPVLEVDGQEGFRFIGAAAHECGCSHKYVYPFHRKYYLKSFWAIWVR